MIVVTTENSIYEIDDSDENKLQVRRVSMPLRIERHPFPDQSWRPLACLPELYAGFSCTFALKDPERPQVGVHYVCTSRVEDFREVETWASRR